MSHEPTRVLSALVALPADPTDIEYTEENGQAFIVLGTLSIALNLASAEAVKKLATVAVKASRQRQRLSWLRSNRGVA